MASTFLGQFVQQGLLDAARSGGLPAYQIVNKAVDWHDKGVLSEDDLIEIYAAQEKRNVEAQRKSAEMKAETEKRIAADAAVQAVKMVGAYSKDVGEQSTEAQKAAGHEPVRVPRRPPKGWRRFRVRGGAAWRRVFHRRRG